MEAKDGKFNTKFLTSPMESIWTALYIIQHSILALFFQCLEKTIGLHTFIHILPATKDINTTDWTAFGFYAGPKWVQNTTAIIKALQPQPFVSFEPLFTVRLEGQ